jgi:Tol biopolymer transport system component
MRRRWFGTFVLVVALLVPATPSGAGTAAPGGRIVFNDAFGGSGIYAIAPDGTNRVRLVPTGDDGSVSNPRWIPGGGGVSFLVSRRLWSYRLDRVDDNGENRTTVFSKADLPPGRAFTGYAWSPDASQLVLALQGVETGRNSLWIADADGTILGRIARGTRSPDWSSTDRIVAVRGLGTIVTMDPFGADVQVVVERGRNVRPRWSPDGDSIVFTRVIHRNGDVMTVHADGTDLTNVTRSPDVYDWSPSWSPTGRHIVWSPSPPGEAYAFADLWRMRAGGGGKTPVSVTKTLDEYDPDWADLPV